MTHAEIPPEKRERKLAAIMLTDIVGFSKKMGANEEAALRMLERHNSLLSGIIEDYKGRILKYMGDAILAEFPSVVEAVRCALTIQAELKTVNQTLPDEEKIIIRIGIHVGDVVVAGGDIFGDGVNIAARIQPLAEPGGINITSTVYNQIKNIPGIDAISLGTKNLKNITDPVEVLKILTGGEAPRPRFRISPLVKGAAAVVAAAGVFGGWHTYQKTNVVPGEIDRQVNQQLQQAIARKPAPAVPAPAPASVVAAPIPAAKAVPATDVSAAIKRGVALYEDKQYDQALAEFSRAIGTGTGDTRPYRYRANIYDKRGEQVKSLADYKRACAMGDRFSCRKVEKAKGR